MTRINYTDEQINEFLDLAQEVGITKAKRELGYPGSWDTANRWAKARDITVATDEVKQRSAAMREWYKDEELITIAQEGMNRVYEELVNNRSLNADEQKKLASAFSTYARDFLTIQGRSTSITETRSSDEFDARIQDMLNQERMKNLNKKEGAAVQD